MKKKLLVAFMMGLFITGCGKETATYDTVEVVEEAEVNEASSSANDEGTAKSEAESQSETDASDSENAEETAWEDYSEEITTKVQLIAAASTTVQEEISQVEELVAQYEELVNGDISQAAMNQAAQWPAYVWDAELNCLWQRMSDELDDDSKATVLENLRQWNAMKEDAIVCAIGYEEDGGSIYGLSYQQQVELMTMKKVYYLANEYAAYRGEVFEMPECPIYGVYVNDEGGTGDIYDSLAIIENYAGENEAEITLYGITTLNGSVSENGDNLSFESEDGDVSGTITYGWDGATFTVDSCESGMVNAGDTFTFSIVF